MIIQPIRTLASKPNTAFYGVPKVLFATSVDGHVYIDEVCKHTSNDETMNLDLLMRVQLDSCGRFLGNDFPFQWFPASERLRSPCGVPAESPWSPVCPAVESGLRPGCRKVYVFSHKTPATAPDSAAYTVLNLH